MSRDRSRRATSPGIEEFRPVQVKQPSSASPLKSRVENDFTEIRDQVQQISTPFKSGSRNIAFTKILPKSTFYSSLTCPTRGWAALLTAYKMIIYKNFS